MCARELRQLQKHRFVPGLIEKIAFKAKANDMSSS